MADVYFHFGRPVIVLSAQPSSFVRVTVLEGWSTPSAFRVTVSVSGRSPSWLPASFQTFLTDTLTFSGVCVLVILKPADTLPEMVFV